MCIANLGICCIRHSRCVLWLELGLAIWSGKVSVRVKDRARVRVRI